MPRILLRNRLDPDLPAVPEATGWSDVTPGDAVKSGADNYGASGHAVRDPNNAALFYAPFDRQGVWKSADYGQTWTKTHSGASIVDDGKVWFLAIAPNSSYLLAGCSGTQNCVKSTDGGVTWFNANSSALGIEIYGVDIDPADSDHVIATSHLNDQDGVYESFDGGATFTLISSTGSGGQSGYAYFGLTADTIIHVADGDTAGTPGTRRATWNGSTWSSWSERSTHRHFHGSHQLYVDRTNGRIWNAHSNGVAYSDDDGLTWTSASSTLSASIIRAGSTMVAGRSYATQSTDPPQIMTSTYPPGTSFSSPVDPTGMDVGPRSMAVTQNPAGQWIVVTTNWVDGIWRLVL